VHAFAIDFILDTFNLVEDDCTFTTIDNESESSEDDSTD
jgi:hypothetical protein